MPKDLTPPPLTLTLSVCSLKKTGGQISASLALWILLVILSQPKTKCGTKTELQKPVGEVIWCWLVWALRMSLSLTFAVCAAVQFFCSPGETGAQSWIYGSVKCKC